MTKTKSPKNHTSSPMQYKARELKHASQADQAHKKNKKTNVNDNQALIREVFLDTID